MMLGDADVGHLEKGQAQDDADRGTACQGHDDVNAAHDRFAISAG